MENILILKSMFPRYNDNIFRTMDVSCIVMARLGVGQNGEEVSLIMSKLSSSDFKHAITRLFKIEWIITPYLIAFWL